MKRYVCVAAALIAFGAAPAAAQGPATVLDWMDGIRPLVRLGDQTITNYDVAVYLAVQRMVAGRPLHPPPTRDEQLAAAPQLVQQIVLLDALRRGGQPPPVLDGLSEVEDRIVDAYGDGYAERFDVSPGVTIGRLRAELQRRALVERYVEDVLLNNVRVSEADVAAYYAQAQTTFAGLPYAVAAPQVRRLLQARDVRDELHRLRDRFLQREKLVIYDPAIRIERQQQREADPLVPIPSSTLP